jgi:hypothetical protein
MNVSMVSVSRSAGPPHEGHSTFFQVGWSLSGLSPVGRHSTSSGSRTGRSSSGTPTGPHFGQWTIGIGAPQ